MKLRKLGFLRHYRKIRIEGTNAGGIVNKCIKNGINLRNLRWENPVESTAEIKGDDLAPLKKAAGYSYKITVLKEGGAIPLFKSMKANIAAITGAFLLGALIFYQGLFVAEIRIDGYRRISEERLRQVIAEAGLYEGARKQGDYRNVKAAVYENFPDITWVSVYEDGRLIKINVAEASQQEAAKPAEDTPVDIVAERSAMIEKIMPLQGNACVRKGDYVNKGDTLISGAYEYQSTDYSKGDEIMTLYSHAKGQVFAKTPYQLTYYLEKNERIKESTGRFIPGIYITLGDFEMDTASAAGRYEASVRKETKILDLVKPIPIKISLIRIEEVSISQQHRDMGKAQAVVEAAVRQYAKENLKEGEEIVNQTVDYSETEGLLKASVFLEVLEDIGEEKPITVKKDKSENEKSSEETQR